MMNGLDAMYGFGWLGMVMGTIFVLLVLTLLVWAAFSSAAHGSASGNERPLDLLKTRYAAGEISKAEFEQAKKGRA